MSVPQLAAEWLPDRAKPVVRSLVHLLAPWMSWRKLRANRATRAQFVDRFFDSETEFEAYEAEFFGGRIVDICRSASEHVADDRTIYDAHMDECVRLYALVRKYDPETLVETGVYHGVSTTSLLLALAENGRGHLYSLDASPLLRDDRATDGAGAIRPRQADYERGRPSCSEEDTHRIPGDRAPGWIIPEELRDRWTLTVGRSQRDLPDVLSAVGPVDLFVHDSEHTATAMLFEFDLAWEHLREGGMAVSFHVDHNDALDTFARERDCERGYLTYTYDGFEDYDSPCRSGYLVKPGPTLFGEDGPGNAEADEDGSGTTLPDEAGPGDSRLEADGGGKR